MAVINPNTYVKLVHTELTPEHQLTFSSLSAQVNYFNNLLNFKFSMFFLCGSNIDNCKF